MDFKDNNSNMSQSPSPSATTKKVAIIGGGITGSSAVHRLFQLCKKKQQQPSLKLDIHLFDQGRRGVGGRSSHRQRRHHKRNHNFNDSSGGGDQEDQEILMQWDHGCQFFRADIDRRFQMLVEDLMKEGIVAEWKGNFRQRSASSGGDQRQQHYDFFGMPSTSPFYVGVDGMQNVCKGIVDRVTRESESSSDSINDDAAIINLTTFTGTRVADLERDAIASKWILKGTSGETAFHDTPEKVVQQQSQNNPNGNILGHFAGYGAVILTDVSSSSFGQWHRASAGVPEDFADRVRRRVGARVPLFTVMIAFDSTNSGIPFDAATFDDNPTLWFASKTNSKPGSLTSIDVAECWTLVSTPEYAMSKIEETPMQDPQTGEFIPQSREYLETVPIPDLKDAFCKELMSTEGILGKEALTSFPEILFMDAQRWGSALPAHKHLAADESSPTRKIISSVPYDSGRSPLAPTKGVGMVREKEEEGGSFLVDNDLMIFQAGDMMSTFTPGFESAAISGMDAAEYLFEKIGV